MHYSPGLTVSLLIIGALMGLDIYSDLMRGSGVLHVITELIVFIISSTFGLLGLKSVLAGFALREAELQNNLANLTADKEMWRNKAQSYIEGFSRSIGDQFNRWNLSEAEKDIALLMLKGLSHKEIALIRGTSEKTVRQQSTTIYQKSGVDGRTQLLAFFLEDLKI